MRPVARYRPLPGTLAPSPQRESRDRPDRCQRTRLANRWISALLTAFLLGIRHGIDWDHIAAITDITSTTASAGMADAAHEEQHRSVTGPHHGHGGAARCRPTTRVPARRRWRPWPRSARGRVFGPEQVEAIRLGTLYALGHGAVVIALGIAALSFGALLPEWLDPIMGRIVGLTLVGLGAWVLYSVVRYARGGESFRLRSRWMLVFDGVRYSWRRFQARLHGHEHTEPLEISSYGPRTAFGVGMIHGIGAETGTQVLLIAAVGGAAASGLGFPMLLAFVLGLLISNFAIVVMTSVGFVASQTRERIYVVVAGRRRVQPRHRDDLPARVRCHPARVELGPALRP